MTHTPFMVTLLPSTDVDLGRWLMQHWQRPYTERPHAPIFHILALLWYGMGKDDYPLLVDGKVKTPTIDKMVAAFDPLSDPARRLVPDPATEADLHAEVMKLQHDARFVMGGGVVHWAYFHFLQHKSVVWPSITTGVPWYETAFLTVGFGLIKYLMYKGLGLDADDAAKSLDTVRKSWDKVDARLSDGRQYLAGDRLTLADLAFAASGAPMVLAKGYAGHLPEFAACPANMQSVIAECRARPAGQFIQRIYDEHR